MAELQKAPRRRGQALWRNESGSWLANSPSTVMIRPLSRLMGRVESAQRQISSQFSLDEDDSALARIRKELLEVIEEGHIGPMPSSSSR